MRIASWNVNSLKVRLPQVLTWLETQKPDVLALQETKLVDAAFPQEAFAQAGYQSVCSGQKTYNGVALLARQPMTEILTDPPDWVDPQRRILAATLGNLRIINLYVVNGESPESEKYAYKLDWLRRVIAWIGQEIRRYPHLVVLGDFNIAPEDRDVYDPDAWEGKILCTSQEREALQHLLALGMQDSFRGFDQAPEQYSWFDYRAAAFRRNHGLRIDLILASTALMQQCTYSGVDRTPRGWERPSDHAPVFADFNLVPPG